MKVLTEAQRLEPGDIIWSSWVVVSVELDRDRLDWVIVNLQNVWSGENREAAMPGESSIR